MSNLPNISVTHTFNGDVAASNKVDAAELDTQLGSLATNDNLQKAAIDRITDGNNDLAPWTVGYSQLKPELALAFASVSGWQPKVSVTVATTANITLTGEQTIDGVLTSSTRVLVKNQITQSQNGIYTSSSGAWTRATDADTGAELVYAVVTVLSGSTQSGTTWICLNRTAPTIGTTAIVWDFAPGTSISAAMRPVVQAQTLALARAAMGPWGDALVTATGSTTARDFQTRFGDFINVKDFGAEGDGSTDDTAAIQAAVNAAVLLKRKVCFPAGTYLVTDQISLPIGSQIIGETGYQYTRGFSQDPKATTIQFSPTTAKSLFVATGTTYGGFRFHYSIEGFYLRGNSTVSGGNSVYALDLNGVIYGRFENIGIEQFTTPIRCTATINNRFVNIYSSGKDQAVLYAGSAETTDVWEQCSFWASPVGVKISGSSIGIRFRDCLFEQIDTYGMDIAREAQEIEVSGCYAEDVPSTNDASAAMFRVGSLGTALVVQTHLKVIGGKFSGRNAGVVGSFLSCDYSNGVELVGVNVSRFTNVILTTANTRDTSVVILGMAGITWTTMYNDVSKLCGVYPSGVVNAGSNNHRIKGSRVIAPDIRPDNTDFAGTLTLSGANLQLAFTAMFPSTNGDKPLGQSNLRFSEVYSVKFVFGDGTRTVSSGSGSPEGVVTAPIGSLYTNTAGGASTTLYVKTSGTGNTGWTAK